MMSGPQRIVVFAPHFAEYAMRLAIGMASRAAIVLLVADEANVSRECDAALSREAREAGVSILTFGSVGRSARVRSLARILGRIVLFRPDVIQVQEQIDALTAWVCRLAGRLYPVLLTVHDPRPHSGNDSSYVVKNAGNRRAIRGVARAFHVHGEFCRTELVAELGAARPILDAAHGNLFVPRPADMAAPEPRTILMFGRIEAYKGHEVLLDAVDLLRSRGCDLRLIVAGRGPEAERLAPRLGARPPGDEVLARYLAPAEVTALFQRAALVIVPYLNATQSGVVAAAFGNGRPVVASRTGGLVDAVRDGEDGLLVPAGDAGALADAIERVLGDRSFLERLAAGARQAAATTFDWTRIAEQIMSFNQAHLLGSGVAAGRSRRDDLPARRHAVGMSGGTATAPLRILFFNPNLLVGGAERHTVDLCERLRARGFTCRILVHGMQRSEVITATPGANDAIFLDLKGMSDPLGWWRVWRALRAFEPDIVVCVNQTPLIISVLERWIGATQAKLACIFHTTELQAFEAYQQSIFRALARFCDLLVYVGENQRRIWEGRGVRARASTVIRNGVDLEMFARQDSPSVRDGLALPAGTLLLGIVASLRPEKNHADLVRALRLAVDRGVQARVLLVGEGPMREEIAALGRELGVADRLIFAGEHADVAPLIAACDAGILCSTIETFPLSAIEFLAAGRPMISARVGGAPEIVREGVNGFLYESGDVPGFADALVRMADPDTRARLAAEARPSVAGLSADAMADTYAAAFRTLAGR